MALLNINENVIGANKGTLLNLLPTLKPLMAFWSDGTIVGNQLQDLSGNGRHATITDNLVTDGNAEFGSILDYWTTAGTCSNSIEQKHSGSKSFKFAVTTAVTTAGARSKKHRTFLGETVTWSVWFYRTVNTTFMFQVYKGDGSVAYQSGISPTLNTWVNYTGSYVETAPGEQGGIGFYINSGNLTMYIDDYSVVITGKPNIGVSMANDATLKAIDTKNLFYTADGIPKTIRSDIGDPTINNLKMFAGGYLKFILLNDIPDVNTRFILNDKFTDHNFLFDSCEVVKTVGTGKTYATIQAAIDSCTTGSINNRFRIDIYDSFYISTYAEYTKAIGIYKGLFYVNNNFIYLNGIGDINIEATLPPDATDTQLVSAGITDIAYSGGFKNIKLKKTNGRYAIHLDASSNANNFIKFVNCSFWDDGQDSIVAYRIANALPSPAYGTGGITPVGMGGQNNFVTEFIGCTIKGVHPITNHGGFASGLPNYLLLHRTSLESLPKVVPSYNPTGAIMASMRLDSTPGTNTVKSIGMFAKITQNVPYSSNSDWQISEKI